jgi:MOSC domain-containing protein YiiM
MSGRVVQIGVAARGGVPKRPVEAAEVTLEGIVGNDVAHREIHGGPDRALCLYSEEHLLALQNEGHPVGPGSIGENLTIAGIDWPAVVPGTILRVGDDLRIEVTSYAAPCKTIARSFADGDPMRVSQRTHPGWSRVYARVLHPGTMRTGDAVRIEP